MKEAPDEVSPGAFLLQWFQTVWVPCGFADQIFPTTFKASEPFANSHNFRHGKSPRMVYGGA